MKIGKMFPGKYIKADDLDGADLPLTIVSCKEELVGQGSDAEQKYVLRFGEIERGLVLNKTNAGTISELHGDDSDHWRGKRISLYPDRCQVGSNMVGCIRVRPTLPVEIDEVPF